MRNIVEKDKRNIENGYLPCDEGTVRKGPTGGIALGRGQRMVMLFTFTCVEVSWTPICFLHFIICKLIYIKLLSPTFLDHTSISEQ